MRPTLKTCKALSLPAFNSCFYDESIKSFELPWEQEFLKEDLKSYRLMVEEDNED